MTDDNVGYHDLRVNPNDLPDFNEGVVALLNDGRQEILWRVRWHDLDSNGECYEAQGWENEERKIYETSDILAWQYLPNWRA